MLIKIYFAQIHPNSCAKLPMSTKDVQIIFYICNRKLKYNDREQHMISDMGIEKIYGSTVAFNATKLKNAKTIWLNNQHQANNFRNEKQDCFSDFTKRYAYAIKETNCFKNETFISQDNITLRAERYGANGTGSNGGGVRCGNLGKYQIKGIGTNCLVGSAENVAHSYGGLDLAGAITETIYSNLLSRMMPLGVAEIIGLIYVGKSSGIIREEKCPGAILVREQCLRPAHFMKAPSHKPSKENERKLLCESWRIKVVTKELRHYLKSDDNYIKFIAEFLSNMANQFGFAKVFGIAHQTLTASNVSLDGRWLDLPLVNIGGFGFNSLAKINAFDEPITILKIIDEMTYTYSKYNKVELYIEPLISYYMEQLHSYYKHYFYYFLGLSPSDSTETDEVNFEIVFNFANTVVIESNKRAQVNESLAVQLICALYSSSYNSEAAQKNKKNDLLNEHHNVGEVSAVFVSILKTVFRSQSEIKKFNHFIISTALKAFKRAAYTGFFNLENQVHKQVNQICNGPDLKEISNLIDTFNNAGKWIFDLSNNSQTTLFKSDKMGITYCAKRGQFVIHKDGINSNMSCVDFFNWLEKIPHKELTFLGFNFKEQLQRFYCITNFDGTKNDAY